MMSASGNIFRVTGPLNSPGTGEFPAQRPVTRSFDVFFDLRLNKLLRKQSWGWWFETLSCPLWCHFNDMRYSSSTKLCTVSIILYRGWRHNLNHRKNSMFVVITETLFTWRYFVTVMSHELHVAKIVGQWTACSITCWGHYYITRTTDFTRLPLWALAPFVNWVPDCLQHNCDPKMLYPHHQKFVSFCERRI